MQVEVHYAFETEFCGKHETMRKNFIGFIMFRSLWELNRPKNIPSSPVVRHGNLRRPRGSMYGLAIRKVEAQ